MMLIEPTLRFGTDGADGSPACASLSHVYPFRHSGLGASQF